MGHFREDMESWSRLKLRMGLFPAYGRRLMSLELLNT